MKLKGNMREQIDSIIERLKGARAMETLLEMHDSSEEKSETAALEMVQAEFLQDAHVLLEELIRNP